MQNRPSYEILPHPVRFVDDSGIVMDDQRRHWDRPITCLHRHDCMELGLCVEGSGTFVVEGKVLDYRAGDVSVIGPKEAHLAASRAGTTSHWRWFYLDFERILLPRFPEMRLDFLASLRGKSFRNLPEEEGRERLRPLLESLFQAREAAARTAWCVLLALELRRLVPAAPPEPAAEFRGGFERIAPAVSWFGAHYAGPLTVSRAARLCGLSATHFRRVFKEETGRSPLEYLNRLRIGMAAAMLTSGQRVAEVAERCGYPSQSSFFRQFKKQYGVSPRDYASGFSGIR